MSPGRTTTATALVSVGTNSIVRSSTGGNAWSETLNSPGASFRAVTSFHATNAQGLIGGAAGAILHTTNSGLTWAELGERASSANLLDVGMAGPNVAWAVGGRDILKTSLFAKTTDGGVNWTDLAAPTGEDLKTMDFIDADHGIAAGTGDDWVWTSDGGQSWDVVQKPTGDDTDDVYLVSPTTAWIVSRFTGYTTDGGATWTEVATGMADGPGAIDFGDADTATLVGAWGGILRSTNAAR